MEFTVSENEIQTVSNELEILINRYRIFLFYGDLGAGKTTLIKKLIEQLTGNSEVQSPTFSLINLYPFNDKTIAHMDWYRINDILELMEIGIEEYIFDTKYICFIEWPEIGIPILKDETFIKIEITHLNDLRQYKINST